MSAHGFAARLAAAVGDRGPLCVGIDPHPALVAAWGLPDDVSGLERFALAATEALAGQVAVLKPQSAFFERFGSRGVAVLERVLAAARAGGALTLLDVKRGDIGSTVAAYAAAYLHPGSPLRADAVTASPYLGFGALRPLVDAARAHGGGLFVLALTSNPEGATVQLARGPDGRTVAEAVLAEAAAVNAEAVLAEAAAVNAGEQPLGPVGAVVGATLAAGPGPLPAPVSAALAALRGPLLAPGLGAQGAQPADLARLFGALGDRVLPSSSREVLAQGPDPARLRAAAARLAGACAAALGRPG